jgi:hypothetical protein
MSIRHTHEDGSEHEHATEMAPEAMAFLQKIEEIAGGLSPDEGMALRRLVKAGLMADEQTVEALTADTAGFHWDPYTGYYHYHYVQPAPMYVQAAPVYVYYPWWWYNQSWTKSTG